MSNFFSCLLSVLSTFFSKENKEKCDEKKKSKKHPELDHIIFFPRLFDTSQSNERVTQKVLQMAMCFLFFILFFWEEGNLFLILIFFAASAHISA